MERTITYEGEPWRVWVNPAGTAEGPESGLILVFTGPDGRQVKQPVDRALLRVLSRDGLELDEALLRQSLAAALESSRATESRSVERGDDDGRA